MSAPVRSRRDAGLRRALGPWALGANIFNTVVGAGIFVLPGALAKEAGSAAPLAYVFCTGVMAGVVVCFAAAGSRVPSSGGPYGVAEAAFGPFVGFLTGVMVWLGSVLAAAGIAAGLADQAAKVWPAMAEPYARVAIVTALLGALGAVNAAGVAPGAGLVGVMTLVKLAPLALLLAAAGFAHPAASLPASSGLGDGLGRAMLIAIFAFQGMETALGVSGEVREPARNLPRALIAAMAAIAVLYLAIQLVVQRVLGAGLAASTAPLADAARAIWPPLGVVLLAGTAASMLGYLAGDMLSAPRLLFAFARDGLAPRALAKLSPRTAAPTYAILAHMLVALVLAVSGGFVELIVLAALASAGVYVVGCAAAVALQHRNVAEAGPPLRVPGLWIAALVGIGGMAWLALNAKPTELEGLAVTLVASAAVYLVARWRRLKAEAA